MTLYVGSDFIANIHCGDNRILEVYKGNDLVWSTYKINEQIFKKDVAGSFQVTLKQGGLFKVTLVGGGGGGSNNFGGAGAGVIAEIRLSRGTYNIVIGSGGAGAVAYVRNNDGQNGNASSFVGSGVNITANGGIRRRGRRNGGGGGNTGNLSYSVSSENTILSRTTNGAETPFSVFGNSYTYSGSGGRPQGNDEGAGFAGQTGYAEIVFLGE